eukprot:3248536-Amphidinium_carterae.1
MFMLPRAFTQTKRWINLTWAYVFSLTVLNFIIQGFLTACVATHITVQRFSHAFEEINICPAVATCTAPARKREEWAWFVAVCAVRKQGTPNETLMKAAFV